MAISDNTFATAKTFSSLTSRVVDVYSVNENTGEFTKDGEINSPPAFAKVKVSGDVNGFALCFHSNVIKGVEE